MKHPMIRMSALAVAMLLAGAVLAAPQAAATGKTGAESPRQDRWLTLDANKDGVIDRSEAARHPRLAERFDRLDLDSDGKLERSELQRSHARRARRGGGFDGQRAGRMDYRGGHGGMARHIALDTDGDGRISKLEAEGSPLDERFAGIDTNKDGYLVRSELQADGERRHAGFRRQAAERFEQRFKEADSNGDGRLSRTEYEAAWPGNAKMFAFLDEDRDGYLTREDLAPRRGR